MSRRLIREEGLLVGGSAGSAMVAAVKVAKTMKAGERLVVILADSVRNYMTKFLNDSWMIENGFMTEDPSAIKEEWWSSRTVTELKLETPFTVTSSVTCSQCVEILSKQGYDQLPCVSEDNEILGMVTLGNLASQITSGRVKGEDSITKCLYTQFKKISVSTKLGTLSKIFDRDHFALVVTTQKCITGVDASNVTEKSLIFGIVTRIDLLNYIVKNDPARSQQTSPQIKKL